jgi:hypothetical protein
VITGSSGGEASHERSRSFAEELGAASITAGVDALLEGAPLR